MSGCEETEVTVTQYTRQHDGSIDVQEVAAVEDIMERYFPSRVDILAKALTERLRVKLEDVRPWSREEVEAVVELVKLMKGCTLTKELLKGELPPCFRGGGHE